MISKERFCKIINNLKEVNEFVKETNERAKKLNDAIISDFYNTMSLSISHEEIVVELLDNMFDTDMISYWIYELDYGKKYRKGCIQDSNGKEINVKTAEKLYDYLVANMIK